MLPNVRLISYQHTYYLLPSYQALYDARAGFAECWLSANKDLNMSANSTVQSAKSQKGPH